MAPSTAPSARMWSGWVWLGPAAILLGLTGWVFQDVLFRGRLLSYRDSLQYYYPLFEFIQQEWEAGRIPLWNPYIQGGTPLLATPTASVLYPFKLVFFLPVSYWARYHLYVLLHVLLAGGSCGWVARKWGASCAGATLAAVSYAFSGNVLFQYCNVVFLCGAAWLPLALWSGDRLAQDRSLARAPLFAVVLALMALAGDPQAGYLAGMLVALHALLLWWQERRARRTSAPPGEVSRPKRSATPRAVLLMAAAALAGCLAAAQVLPTLQLSAESVRAARDVPSSLWEVPRFLMRRSETIARGDTGELPQWYEGMIGNPPPPGKHELSTYAFTLEPWRLVEFVWPSISGRFTPHERDWMFLLGWIEEFWTPSQYMGLLPFLLAISAWRIRNTDARTRWMSWAALLSLLASFGSWGPGRLWWPRFEESPESLIDGSQEVAGAVGGMYWLMVVVLPGFSEFRYPAKLLVVTACALSLLAATGFDRLQERARRGWTIAFVAIAVLSGVLGAALIPARSELVDWLERKRTGLSDTFDPSGVWWVLETTLWETAAVAGGLALLVAALHRIQRSRSGETPLPPPRWLSASRIAWALVLVTAIDLAWANTWMIQTTDRAAWERTPELVTLLEQAEGRQGIDSVRPLRMHRSNGWYRPIRDGMQGLEADDIIQWQRATLFGLQNLPYRISDTNGFGTLPSNTQEVWYDFFVLGKRVLRPRRAYDAWGTGSFIVPDRARESDYEASSFGLRNQWARGDEVPWSFFYPQGPPLDPAAPGEPRPLRGLPDVQVLLNDNAFPPAWIVHRIRPLEPIPHWDRKRWLPVMFAMVFPRQEFDMRQEAFVEDAQIVQSFGRLPVEWPHPDAARESCRLTRYEPLVLELDAELASPGLVVLSEYYTADWTAEVSTNGGPLEPQAVLRANRTMRGLLLPAGRHHIVMRYKPTMFYVGATISLAAWGAVVFWGALRRLRRRPASATSRIVEAVV